MHKQRSNNELNSSDYFDALEILENAQNTTEIRKETKEETTMFNKFLSIFKPFKCGN